MKMEEAALISVNCVRAAANFSGTMKAEDSLATLGITHQLRVKSLRDRLVNDASIGVGSVGHVLDPAFLATLSGAWTLIQLILTVFNNSVTGSKKPASTRAEEALRKIQL